MRSLAAIVHDLDLALKREAEDAILIGRLLTEAKRSPEIQHGNWYDWLDQNFAMSVPSASRYMRLYEGTKSLNLSDLKIRTSLLYALFVDDKFAEPVKQKLLHEARTKWVGLTRAEQFQREHDQSDGKPPRDWLIDWEEAQRLASECAERLIRVKKAELTNDDRQVLAAQVPQLEDNLLRALNLVRSFRDVVQFAEAAE